MKKIISILVLFTGLNALADSVDCFMQAKNSINHDQVVLGDIALVRLCQNTTNFEAIKCFNQSESLDLALFDRVSLCAGANSTAPIKCYLKAQALLNLHPLQIIQLCAVK
jgi:hypothetical protein